MKIRIFVTAKPDRSEQLYPIVAVPLTMGVAPPHPANLPWREYATTTTNDRLLLGRREAIEKALQEQGYFIIGSQPADRRGRIEPGGAS